MYISAMEESNSSNSIQILSKKKKKNGHEADFLFALVNLTASFSKMKRSLPFSYLLAKEIGL